MVDEEEEEQGHGKKKGNERGVRFSDVSASEVEAKLTTTMGKFS